MVNVVRGYVGLREKLDPTSSSLHFLPRDRGSEQLRPRSSRLLLRRGDQSTTSREGRNTVYNHRPNPPSPPNLSPPSPGSASSPNPSAHAGAQARAGNLWVGGVCRIRQGTSAASGGSLPDGARILSNFGSSDAPKDGGAAIRKGGPPPLCIAGRRGPHPTTKMFEALPPRTLLLASPDSASRRRGALLARRLRRKSAGSLPGGRCPATAVTRAGSLPIPHNPPCKTRVSAATDNCNVAGSVQIEATIESYPASPGAFPVWSTTARRVKPA